MTAPLPLSSKKKELCWREPTFDTIEELENNMLLNTRGRGVKLWGGDKVRKDGVATSAHWICVKDWERFKEHAVTKGLSMAGQTGMKEFYKFVLDPANQACGFTVVAQLMDTIQYERLSWRLLPLAGTILGALSGGDSYEGSKSGRAAAANMLPKQKSKILSGSKVCCATVFKHHTCVPVTQTFVHSSSEAGSQSASLGVSNAEGSNADEGEDDSITSASGLESRAIKKQISHAPSARCAVV